MDCDVEIHAGGDEEGEGNGGEEIVAVDAYLSPQPAEATASKTEGISLHTFKGIANP